MWIIQCKGYEENYSVGLTNDYLCDKVILTCTECLSRNYTTTRNKKTHTERLELNKYCKKCGKKTVHKETK